MYNTTTNDPRSLDAANIQSSPNRQYFGKDIRTPYIRAVTTHMPNPMPGEVQESDLYPLESSLVTPQFNSASEQGNVAYAKGGMIRRERENSMDVLPSLAELIRREGNEEDTILAHINPIEAMILREMGGSGDINPRTGLPQFSFWTKPGKAIGSSLGSLGGVVLGNMLLPGIGGVIGGALGQGAQHAMRGKSFGQGALKGASIGAAAPTIAGLGGSLASSLGATSLGTTLSNYGAQNSILAALGLGSGGGGMGAANAASAMMPKEVALSNLTNNVAIPSTISGGTNAITAAAPTSFMDKLIGNSSNFLSQPANLLALASAVGSFAGRPKEKSPERKAKEEKRYEMAKMLTPEERAKYEVNMLADKQMARRLEMNKFLPEERFAVTPRHRKTNTPEEYKRTGKWLEYFDNPDFTGAPITMKKGGKVPHIEVEEIEMEYPSREGFYLQGSTNGQDDKVKALLSDGEYVIPADVVAHIGDGNSNAGAKKFDQFLKNIRKAKGGKINLPPKSKSLASYIMR